MRSAVWGVFRPGRSPPQPFEHWEKLMQHSLQRDAKLAALALIALSSVYATTQGAVAQPHRYAGAQPRRYAVAQPPRYINGHVSLCGQGTIPVRVYAAEYYYARPLVCGGGQVNDNVNPDFQLTRGGRGR
jgi:hypothetical protein